MRVIKWTRIDNDDNEVDTQSTTRPLGSSFDKQ